MRCAIVNDSLIACSVPSDKKLVTDCSESSKKRLRDLSSLNFELKSVREKYDGNVKIYQFQYADGSTVSMHDLTYPSQIDLFCSGLVGCIQVTVQLRSWLASEPIIVTEVVIAGNQCTEDAGAETIST